LPSSLTLHDLRHVAASALIAQGSASRTFLGCSGHASPAITINTYAHVFEPAQHDDRTRDQMEAAFGGMLG
jgi:integrase